MAAVHRLTATRPDATPGHRATTRQGRHDERPPLDRCGSGQAADHRRGPRRRGPPPRRPARRARPDRHLLERPRRLRHRLLRGVCALGAVAMLASAAPARGADDAVAKFNPPKRYYLALGDSHAYGFQGWKFAAGLPAAAFDTGYVDVFAARLRAIRPDIAVVNYGCPGESSGSFIAGPCLFDALGLPLHDDFDGSQLAAATAFLDAHPGQVSPITLQLFGNDMLDLIGACAGDLGCIQRAGARRDRPARAQPDRDPRAPARGGTGRRDHRARRLERAHRLPRRNRSPVRCRERRDRVRGDAPPAAAMPTWYRSSTRPMRTPADRRSARSRSSAPTATATPPTPAIGQSRQPSWPPPVTHDSRTEARTMSPTRATQPTRQRHRRPFLLAVVVAGAALGRRRACDRLRTGIARSARNGGDHA